jgi:hypothetical protein
LDELRFVILDGVQVASAVAPPGDGDVEHDGQQSIGQVCPKVRELDLSRNLFDRFGPVVEICSELPLLRSLRVKCVCFQRPNHSSVTNLLLLVGTGSNTFWKMKSWHQPATPSPA